MANRKIASELNELLKSPGGTKGVRTLGAYRKNRESVELGDDASKAESDSKCDDESKRKEDDLEGKSSQECSGENSEANSKTASTRNINSSKVVDEVCDGGGTVDKDRNVKEKTVSGEEKTTRPDSEDRSSRKQEEIVVNNKKENNNSVDKQCAIKSGNLGKQTGIQSEQQQTGKEGNSGLSSSGDKSKVRTRPVIGPELLLKKDTTSGTIQNRDSRISQETKRNSFHERYTRKEISAYNSNTQIKETESSDVNSNVKTVPKIGRMGFSLDLNKELNAKFAAARQQMIGSKKQVPITTTPTEGKKQPPVPLPRPRKPEGRTLFEVKRERSKRGVLVDPEEQKEKTTEDSSKYVDLDTGHIYEDIDFYQKPQQKCETCNKEKVIKDEEGVKEGEEVKKDEKKKKRSKLSMLCMCRQTSSDLPSASLSEKSESKICLLHADNMARYTESEKKEKDGGGYERLQRQKPSFRGGYEALRNSSPEEEESKLPPEGTKAAEAIVEKRELKNESTKSESTISNDSSFSSEHSEKHVSKESSFESKSESSNSKKSLSKSVRFEEKTENIVEESSEEHRSSGKFEHKLGVHMKRREVVYAKVMKASHKSEHSESVVEAGDMPAGFSRSSRLQKFGAVPVSPFEGRLSLLGKMFHEIRTNLFAKRVSFHKCTFFASF